MTPTPSRADRPGAPPGLEDLAARGPGPGPRRSLASRLTGLSLGAAALALLVAGLVLNGAMYLIELRALQDEATAQARVIADNTMAALLFADRLAAQETLQTLARSPRVARATLYDLQGAVFADYQRADAALPRRAGPPLRPAASHEPSPAAPGIAVVGHALVTVEPVSGARGPAGWLRLEAPLAPLYRASALFGAITLASAAVAMLLAWAFAVGVRRDVARIEARLDHLAYHDPVTRLYNRHAAGEHLIEYMRQARASGSGFSIVSVDLDNFKTINDTLGHHIGDQVLDEIAHRLGSSLGPGARAYRFGGDEFMVISPGDGDPADPLHHGQMIRHTLSGVLHIEGYEITLSGSAGVARFPQDGDTAEAVMLASDMAMYQAKARGKNGLVVFDDSLRAASRQRLRVESDLRAALRDHELRLLYQPIVDVTSGTIVGAEALVRWQHPSRGLLGPLEFIAVAEQSGQIVPLGGWVLGEAAQQLARWQAQGLHGLRVAVNVSAGQLRRGQLREQIREAVAAAGADLEGLGLEIELTEHTLIEDVDENLQLLRALRAEGVRIAIDDFGTGLSSLAYLKRLPIDKLKIDRSFIMGLPDDAGDRAIVGAALSMARALGLCVVAEGVETEAQRRALAAMGCDLAQGWLFGRPMAADAFMTLVRAQRAGQVPATPTPTSTSTSTPTPAPAQAPIDLTATA